MPSAPSIAPPNPVLHYTRGIVRDALAVLTVPPTLPSLPLPTLPSRTRPESSLPPRLSATHALSTHIVVAAWPRLPSQLFDEQAHAPPPKESKQERKDRVNRELTALMQRKRRQEREEFLPEEFEHRGEVIYQTVNRYARKNEFKKDGLTIIVVHAVGFPKEIWEPSVATLIESTEAQGSKVTINEVWVIEAANHGDSALINEGKVGDMVDWAEHGRDVVNFLLNYLPENPTPATPTTILPDNLPRVPSTIARTRHENGYWNRRVFGLGHSAGGTGMLMGAIFEPKLFDSLMMIEPMVFTPEANENPIFNTWVSGALGRRDKWASREEALKLYKASPSFSYWDPEVLDTFIKYGLTEDKKTGGVKLKGPVYLEAVTFSERRNGAETYYLLPKLDPKIALRFIYGNLDGHKSTGGETSTRHVAHKRTVNTSNILLPAPHLMVQSHPGLLAQHVAEFLTELYAKPVAKL